MANYDSNYANWSNLPTIQNVTVLGDELANHYKIYMASDTNVNTMINTYLNTIPYVTVMGRDGISRTYNDVPNLNWTGI